MRFKEFLKLCVEHNSQKNKKEMLKHLKGIYISSPKNKSILIIASKLLNDLLKRDIIRKVAEKQPAENVDGDRFTNIYYEVVGTDMVLLRVRDCFYKIIPKGDVVKYLSNNFHFKYYSSGRVCTFIKDMQYIGIKKIEGKLIPVIKIGKQVEIEQILLDYKKYGKLNTNKITTDVVHHKWLRLCAHTEAIKLMDAETHLEFHRVIGNYARNQCVILETFEEFTEFMSIVKEVNNILKNRKFSLEF